MYLLKELSSVLWVHTIGGFWGPVYLTLWLFYYHITQGIEPPAIMIFQMRISSYVCYVVWTQYQIAVLVSGGEVENWEILSLYKSLGGITGAPEKIEPPSDYIFQLRV